MTGLFPIRFLPVLPRRLLRRLAWIVPLSASLVPFLGFLPAYGQETPYEVALTGIEDGDLRTVLTSSSSLFRLEENPPPSPIGLRRRADADRQRLLTALRSAGFYDASIDIRVDTDTTPAQVTVAVEPGSPYVFGTVNIESAGEEALPTVSLNDAGLGLERGSRARAPAVLAAESRITAGLAEKGHPFARVVDRRTVVDHSTRTMDITYFVDAGPFVRLGEVRFEGLEQVEPGVVTGRIPWQPGAPYTPERIEELRSNLSGLGVFSSIRIDVSQTPEADGTAPVTVRLTERKFRFIGAGLNYSTSEGFGGRVYWGHRNLFGGAEQLRLAAQVARVGANTVTETDFAVTANFRKPDFLILNQSLVLDAALISENPDAYQRDALVLTARLERVLTEGLTVGYGVTFEQARITDTGGRTDTTLVGLPLSFSYDRSDNLLNPTQGYRIDLTATPYADLGDRSSGFLVSRWTNTAYYDVADNGWFVLAGRLTLGSIAGASLFDIPADKRFYAGGGGSIRGYAFQDVGPRDDEGDPIGGRSLFEVSAEMRIKVTESIGVVPFIDGGNVFDAAYPDFSRDIQWGAGLGLRYYTGFGPLRFDVAVPVNKRDDDDPFQVYISLGQAF